MNFSTDVLRPSKCQVGFGTVDYLGFHIGDGIVETQAKKIEEVMKVSTPETKTQIRYFLGMVNFHRKLIPNMVTIAMPLVDCIRKGKPNKVVWGEGQERAFQQLKPLLSKAPVLRLPGFSRPFVLLADASNV